VAVENHSLLSCAVISKQLGKGIIIDPFDPTQLKTCSYDVRLGGWYFRRQTADQSNIFLFNPYDQKMVKDHYGQVQEARLVSEMPQFCNGAWEGLEPTDRIIIMKPDEMILAHTEEFIGGTKDPVSGRCFTAEMKARSSVGRVGFEVCRCAGWGDVGYVNRWTMEIVCTSTVPIILVIGTRLAQMKFYEVDSVNDNELYGHDNLRDHYQTGVNIEAIKNQWQPEMMLPHLTKK